VIKLLLIAFGGAIGSVARYLVSSATLTTFGPSRFPLGTLVVNGLGCLAVGVLAGMVAKYNLFSDNVRLLLFVGIAGGFTTFSAFGLESFELLRREEWFLAIVYVASSLLLGLTMVAVGYLVINR
jgi:CrcB protein